MVTEEQRRERKTERKRGMRGTKMSTLKRKKENEGKKTKRQRGEGPEG